MVIFLEYFSDSVLRAPVIGCMLMCLASSLVGVIVFLRKESLLGESLSHAAYPGVILGIIFAGLFDFNESQELEIALFIMFGAFSSALLGLWFIHLLQSKLKVRSDSALCFVLSCFFGIGITLSSEVQFTYTALYRQVQAYLFGQAATMTDIYIFVYGFFALIIAITIAIFYKELQLITFDRSYAKSLGINASAFDNYIFVLIVLAVVIGIRSVGVVLMSAMLIAPAASARQFTNKLSKMFLLAAFFGLLSGFFGVYFSVELSYYFAKNNSLSHFVIPTGPMIVIVISLVCLFSLLLAPEKGLLWRLIRIGRFRYQCFCENLLKSLWIQGTENEIILQKQQNLLNIPFFYLSWILWRFKKKGWIQETILKKKYLSQEGLKKATQIVRLHRLWEVYLADYLGVGAERVHRSAEEMEHIITPELEQELTLLLNDPKRDPHYQPIPPKT
jgi:manganese/zinc/iron transport system permease protein